jgi:hypothetical protein
MPHNPNDAYEARRTEIAELLGRIRAATVNQDLPSRPDWADVGSLTEIAGRLRDVAEFAERTRR